MARCTRAQRSLALIVLGCALCVAQQSLAQTASAPTAMPSADKDRSAVLRAAEQAFTKGPFSVVQKTRTAPSGNKHDFYTQAPYWWPDPSKPDGLPYIRRDGEVNPESKAGTDDIAWGNMADAVADLTAGYRATGDERFAARAALLLRAWFLDPATRMNPHLDYAQFIPGHNDGRGAGLIATRRLVSITEDARTLEKSPAWTAVDRAGLREWCAAYAVWLRSSPNGREEAGARNNHGTWYDGQLAALLLYTGQRDEARKLLDSRTRARISEQIEPDGRQPLELARTRSWSYSVMNLVGWFAVARLAQEAGVDLWNYKTPDGRSIRGALDYLVPYAADLTTWQGQQITPPSADDLIPVLREAQGVWQAPSYGVLADRLSAAGKR